jgi:hypothetical protein
LPQPRNAVRRGLSKFLVRVIVALRAPVNIEASIVIPGTALGQNDPQQWRESSRVQSKPSSEKLESSSLGAFRATMLLAAPPFYFFPFASGQMLCDGLITNVSAPKT